MAAESREDAPSRRYSPTKGQILRVLTFTQNSSALVFSVFVGIHLTSPLAAALGGASWADKTMMIGRDLYLPLEPILVYIPIAVHLTSSILRRTIITFSTGQPPKLNAHLVTGWLLPFFLLPHIASHRLIPSSPTLPISALSPSELSFEYVGWGINRYPLLSIVGYGGLVIIGCWHAGVGLMKVVSWIGRSRRSAVESVTTDETVVGLPPPVSSRRRQLIEKRRGRLRGMFAAFLGVMVIGMIRVARDARGVSKIMERRYEAVYRALPWGSLYRLD